MAQFVAYDKNVKVNGDTILAFVNSISDGKENRLRILKRRNIDPKPNMWYSQQDWLDAFSDAKKELGDMILFLIGKSIIDHAKFPPIQNLEEALQLLDKAYHMNHKGGYIGNYKLVSFDEVKKIAIMECTNPYPSKFDEGILTQLLRKYRPSDSISAKVTLDTSKPTRNKGADSCTYTITW